MTKKLKGNPYSTMNLVKRMQNGATEEELNKEMREHDILKAKEKGKVFGECESCGLETVLVEEVGLCGPCCWGEAETSNGNW